MSTPFNPEWLKPGAAVEVSMDNLAAYHAEVQRLMEENATLREAAQQALEALEGKRYTACGWRSDCDKAITALRAALAEPVQEPVAWMDIDSDGNRLSVRQWSDGNRDEVPLYTAPPRCSNCASLEAQNTELDQKLAQMERKLKSLTEAVLRANGIGGK